MPSAHRTLLEHLLAFLAHVAAPFTDGGFRRLLARVWAPCMLRAPARTMSQFRGKVIDAMGVAILALIEARAPPPDASHDGEDGGEDGGGEGSRAGDGETLRALLSAHRFLRECLDMLVDGCLGSQRV